MIDTVYIYTHTQLSCKKRYVRNVMNILSLLEGKCSHGGRFDQTSTHDPVGGINKDAVDSSHGSLHQKAADLAVDATLELLEDIRLAVGDKNFLRYEPITPETFGDLHNSKINTRPLTVERAVTLN